MPAFSDVEQITIRVGPRAHRFGDDWERSCQGKVEHDRWIYLYAIAGEFGPAEMKEIIRETRKLAHQFGWRGIRWQRLRRRANGAMHEHLVEFPIRKSDLTAPDDAG